MQLKRIIFPIVFGVVLSIQLVSVYSTTDQPKCLNSVYHKKVPSAERGPGYVDCLPWRNNSCCPANVTKELKNHDVKTLYHFDWNHCGNLSKECHKYMKNEVCFYQCDPNAARYLHKERGSEWPILMGIPVCSSYCDKWFEACKNDKTYSSTWYDDYIINATKVGPTFNISQCRTFTETFKNGKGLCNTLWGKSYQYAEKTSNCMVLDFKGPNPNDRVTKEVGGLGNSVAQSSLMLFAILFSHKIVFY